MTVLISEKGRTKRKQTKNKIKGIVVCKQHSNGKNSKVSKHYIILIMLKI